MLKLKTLFAIAILFCSFQAQAQQKTISGTVTDENGDRKFSPHQYLWPFHESSLKVEPGLTQNPGY